MRNLEVTEEAPPGHKFHMPKFLTRLQSICNLVGTDTSSVLQIFVDKCTKEYVNTNLIIMISFKSFIHLFFWITTW